MRPALRYPGGKWRLAPFIARHLPPHKVYVEPYGGAASVLLRKPPSESEVYNDLDSHVVNLYRVLRDPEHAKELARVLSLTPYSREEWLAALSAPAVGVEGARAFLTRSWLSYANLVHAQSPGFRVDGAGGVGARGGSVAREFAGVPARLAAITARLRGVIIENLPAREVLARYRHPHALLYLDPPYLPSTRNNHERWYAHEMSEGDHMELLQDLLRHSGPAVVSAYQSPLYDGLLLPAGFSLVRAPGKDVRGRVREEVLYVKASSTR